jgi:hypothetical protein
VSSVRFTYLADEVLTIHGSRITQSQNDGRHEILNIQDDALSSWNPSAVENDQNSLSQPESELQEQSSGRSSIDAGADSRRHTADVSVYRE